MSAAALQEVEAKDDMGKLQRVAPVLCEGLGSGRRMHTAYLVLDIDLGLCLDQLHHHLSMAILGSSEQRRAPALGLRKQKQEEGQRVIKIRAVLSYLHTCSNEEIKDRLSR